MENKICNIVRDVLPLYIDNVVCDDTREWVEAHLAECPECAKVAEEMRVQPELPANADIQKHNMNNMRNFKRLFNKRWLKITAVTALSAVVIMIAAMFMLIRTVEVIEYDGSNFEIIEDDQGDGLLLRYYGRGEVRYSVYTVPATGEATIVLTQSLWDKHIEPMYDGVSGRYYLMDSDRALIIREQETGEILWDADEEQTVRYYERLSEDHPEYMEQEPLSE